VSYDAVIDVGNGDLRLRPGMTATVTFVYGQSPHALAAPSAALRFRPAQRTFIAPSAPNTRTLWTFRAGTLQPFVVQTGLADGFFTEILEQALHEGDEVVIQELGNSAPTALVRPGRPPPIL
jgi:HlyD family secretion protein